MPYSGPLSGYSGLGQVAQAYFEKVNAEGGITGRKLKLHSLDDAYSPPKTVEQTRQLVEQDEVLLVFGSLGTATNSAVHRYLNAQEVPHLFFPSGATKSPTRRISLDDARWLPPSEGVIYANTCCAPA